MPAAARTVPPTNGASTSAASSASANALAPGAVEAPARLTGRGIGVEVLTGDHPATAARLCRDPGLEPRDVVDAGTPGPLDDGQPAGLADRTTVFARRGPEGKARIVTAPRAHGRTVGFVGDGVNDLPAPDAGICPPTVAPAHIHEPPR